MYIKCLPYRRNLYIKTIKMIKYFYVMRYHYNHTHTLHTRRSCIYEV